MVALRHVNLRTVTVENHDAVLRLLADRHHDLVAQRTRVVCRLHALLTQLREGGVPKALSADRASAVLTTVDPSGAADVERKRICLELVDEIGRLDTQLAELRRRTVTAVTASATTVTDVYGVGPTCAAIIVGHTGGVGRFPTAGHFARFNGTAPIDASSGAVKRHRLNPAGTARSTTPSTSPPSPRSPTTPQGAPTTYAKSPRTRLPERPFELSNVVSATPSTGGSSTT